MRSCGPCHCCVLLAYALPLSQPWIKNTRLVLFIFKDWVVVPKCFLDLCFPRTWWPFGCGAPAYLMAALETWGLMKVCFPIPSPLFYTLPCPPAARVLCPAGATLGHTLSHWPLCSCKHTWHVHTHTTGISCPRHLVTRYFSRVVLPLGPVNTYWMHLSL